MNTQSYPISNCPAQDENYGDSLYFEGEGFTCRYILSKRGPFKKIYIPYGPNFEDVAGFKNFLKWINSFKLTKIHIDFYRIFSHQNQTLNLMQKAGFRPAKYLQDAQTSVVTKASFEPNSRARRYIKSALKHHSPLSLIGTEDADIIDQCYQIYRQSCQLKGYQLKRTKQYFYQLAAEGILTIAKDNESGEINCFLLSTVRQVESDSGPKKINYLVFTAMTERGRNLHLGFLVTADQFKTVFSQNLADESDFMGFSAEAGKHSIFKTKFGNQIIDLAGSFSRFKLFATKLKAEDIPSVSSSKISISEPANPSTTKIEAQE